MATITDLLNTIIANQAAGSIPPATTAQIATIAAGVAAIQEVLPAPSSGTPISGTTTTTATITNLNLADASVSATGAGLFTPGTFVINGVTVTVNPNDSLATIATNIQAALQAANHVNASAAATDIPGNFTLTVVDPSTNVGLGFTGSAVAGLTIPAPTFS